MSVDGPHGTRGPVGEFGAPRSGGRPTPWLLCMLRLRAAISA